MTVRAEEEFAEPGLGAGRLRALRRRAQWLARERLAAWLREDRKALGLWTPVAIGAGAGIYFGLKTEPAAIIGVGALLAAGAAAVAIRRLRPVLLALFFAALGFIAADWRTAQVYAPALDRELGIAAVTGRLVAIEEFASYRRLTLALESIEDIDGDALPARARVTWRGEAFDAALGDLVRLRAGLGSPPPPIAPGAFDYARLLYFERIGAVGFAVTPPEVLLEGEQKVRFSVWVGNLRATLFQRITTAAPSQGGAIVAAIVTGRRDAIKDEARYALRDAGLAHLLAISGLHMGLATGLIFFAVRLGLAAIEPLALRFPIKKWAAAAALASGLFYLVISGSGWSARRAFIMAAIIFAAILVDRRALSLRNVAIAACAILLTTPEAVFHPGFQMSFAAVTALIAGYEWMSRRADPNRSFTLPARVKRYGLGLAATDIIAASATAPFALYHFNRVALYSLPANILAMPLMAFWIMPAAVTGLILAPFGLDAWAWRVSAAGVETILAIAKAVSSWPGSVSLTPQWPLAALLALVLGGLWLCLARSPLRLAGLLGMPLAALIVAGVRTPDVFVAASGRNAAVIAPAGGGELIAYSTRRDRFSLSRWREAAGFDWTEGETSKMRDSADCDDAGCVMALPGKGVISFIEDESVLAEDCARTDLVVAFFFADGKDWRACNAVLIDRGSVWRRGAHAAWLDEGAVDIRTVAEARGTRPWTPAQ